MPLVGTPTSTIPSLIGTVEDVDAPPPPPDPTPTPAPTPSPPPPSYAVYLRDAGRQVVGVVDDWTSLHVVARFNDVGTWVVVMPTYTLPLIGPGGGILIERNGQPLMSGVFDTPSYVRNSQFPDGAVLLGGVSDEALLFADRLAWPDPAHSAAAQTVTVDSRSGPAETLLYTYANLNAGPGALAARRVTGLTMGTDQGRGTTVHTTTGMATKLLDRLATIAVFDGLGFRVVPSGTGIVFEVYDPDDVSGAVRFSWDNGNLTDLTYTPGAPKATRAIVGSSGTTKTYLEVGDPTAEADWGRRIETYVDSSGTDTATMTSDGQAELARDAATVTVTVTVLDTGQAAYGTSWAVGSKVAVDDGVVEIVDVVRQVEFDVTASVDGPLTETLTPTVGTPGVEPVGSDSDRLVRDLAARLARLAARS